MLLKVAIIILSSWVYLQAVVALHLGKKTDQKNVVLDGYKNLYHLGSKSSRKGMKHNDLCKNY